MHPESSAGEELTLYTRAGCHLCDEMKAELEPLAHEFGLALQEVDVDGDTDLRRRFGEEVPVLFLAGRKVAKYRLDTQQLRRLLAREQERKARP